MKLINLPYNTQKAAVASCFLIHVRFSTCILNVTSGVVLHIPL